jgi:hypothetical protein
VAAAAHVVRREIFSNVLIAELKTTGIRVERLEAYHIQSSMYHNDTLYRISHQKASGRAILRSTMTLTRRAGLVLLLILFGAVSIASCQSDARLISQLRVGNVPVHPLTHNLEGATVAFPEAFPMQVALYWSSQDENPLAMIHALRAMGVPFFVTRDLTQALGHKLIIIYPNVDPKTFTSDEIQELTQHVRAGGSIFAVDVLAGALKPLFGFRDSVASRRRYRVDFAPNSDPALRYLNRPEEQSVPLGNTKYTDIFWTNGYTPGANAKVLARYEDGTAALLRNAIGEGSTYLCGISYHEAVLRNQVNRDYDAERHYVNNFEPGADVWMLLLRAWYESNTPDGVRLASIPDGQDSVLLLSHDVDWENSFAPMLDFAHMEIAEHARSTFFIQTKYVSDANSVSFFFGNDLAYLDQIKALGFTVGSHSIIHSRAFNHFDLGDGTESFPLYQPRGTGFESATGATVFGEVRVSKQLLDGNLPGQQTIFFRAGHLRVPPSLPEALIRTGYLYDSSFTADDVLTHFPYALPLGLDFDEDSGLYEFPVTFEDEEKPPLPERIDRALDVIRANAENQAINVILIHSNEAHVKLGAEQMLLRELPHDVTATDLQSYAEFWRALEALRWSVHPGPGANEVSVDVAAGEPVSGATFEFQRSIAAIEGCAGARVLPDHHRIVLPALKAQGAALFDVHYSE